MISDSKRREYYEKNRIKLLEYSRKYYRKQRLNPEFVEREKERSRLNWFAKNLLERVRVARKQLKLHLQSKCGVLNLDNCNVCVVKQGKLDCAEKLYEVNLIERDVSHGDVPMVAACAINLVREVKPPVPRSYLKQVKNPLLSSGSKPKGY